MCKSARRYLTLRGTLKASEIPTIRLVSQPGGRFTDCHRRYGRIENESVTGTRSPTWPRFCVKAVPPFANGLFQGTRKNSLFTTTTGGRVTRTGRAYSIPGRNRRRAEASRSSGNRPSTSVRRFGRHGPQDLLRVRFSCNRFSYAIAEFPGYR